MYLESMVWLVSDMWIGGENTVHPDHWNCSSSKELLWPATDLWWTAWERKQEDHVYVSDSTVCLERVEWLVCHLWGSHAHKKNTVSIIVFVIGYCSPRKLSGKWYTLLWRSLESLHFQRSAFVGGRQVPSWRWSCWAFTNDNSLEYTFTQMCLQVSVFGLKLINTCIRKFHLWQVSPRLPFFSKGAVSVYWQEGLVRENFLIFSSLLPKHLWRKLCYFECSLLTILFYLCGD